MGKRPKLLFVGLSYLKHNYGAQGIAFPLIEKLNSHFAAEYIFVLSRKQRQEHSFLSKYPFIETITSPKPFVILGKCNFLFYLFYLILKRRVLSKEEKARFFLLVNAMKDSDVVIDLSGIEFIGNLPLKRRYISCLSTISMQLLAEKCNKIYLKFTKSYGSFPDKDKIYKLIVEKQLNKLPFLFVRGENNLKEMKKKLNLKVPLYSFPDISISLEAESKQWALTYVSRLGVNLPRKIVGLSPSTVIAGIKTRNNSSSCGANHIMLCKQIIEFYQLNGLQVLLIPHSIDDGRNIKSCDLALTRKIYNELENKRNVFLFDDMNLTYGQVRAIIGLLDFYVASRYHSVASALSMAVPVVALSWHIKYKDIMCLFLNDFLVIDCRTNGIKKSLALIKKYYDNRQWFDKEKMLERKKDVVGEIDKSVTILANGVKRFLEHKNKRVEKCSGA